jgi:hypothetical protein
MNKPDEKKDKRVTAKGQTPPEPVKVGFDVEPVKTGYDVDPVKVGYDVNGGKKK